MGFSLCSIRSFRSLQVLLLPAVSVLLRVFVVLLDHSDIYLLPSSGSSAVLRYVSQGNTSTKQTNHVCAHDRLCVSYLACTRFFQSVLSIHTCNFLDLPLLALNNLFYMIPQYPGMHLGLFLSISYTRHYFGILAATPQSELRNQIQEEIDKTQFKIKVIEKSGRKLIRHLQRNDPFKKKECRNNDECMICSGNTDTAGSKRTCNERKERMEHNENPTYSGYQRKLIDVTEANTRLETH